jgi:hypothetical protein
LRDDTPTYEEAGLVPIHADVPVVLGKTGGEDREPKISVLNNGTTAVFWVNRNGSHHVNGVDATGKQVFPTITEDNAIDILLGIHTTGNTNWTLNKADRVGGGFLAAATWAAGALAGSEAIILDTVVDADGIVNDEGQGHGFLKLFNSNLEPTTSPISISQFTAGHREWDCCWLSDGKFVITTVAQDHRYAEDPDYPAGGAKVGTVNIFNADGTRFKDEFFIDDLVGQKGDMRCGALSNGFAVVYVDDQSAVGGQRVVRGVTFDNAGNRLKEFVANDTTTGSAATWMDAGGGNQLVTIHQIVAPEGMGFPADVEGANVILAQLWNAQGEPIGPAILCTQHSSADNRSLGRPRVAMAPNGSFCVSWEDNVANDVDGVPCVVCRVFNADGTPATDAFIPHKLPEFTVPGTETSTGGGAPGEGMPGMNNDYVAITWGSRGINAGANRDVVVTVFPNPAKGAAVSDWALR